MEFQEFPPLFTLSIDPATKTHLEDAAQWARFLALAGMVVLGLAVAGVIAFGTYISLLSGTGSTDLSDGGFSTGLGVGLFLLYLLLIGVWFFPLLSLLRFANQLKLALAGNDQQALAQAALNLKNCFRYVGIITILVVVLYAILIVVTFAGLAASSL